MSFASPNAFADNDSYTVTRNSKDDIQDESENQSYEPNFGGRPV